MGLTAALTLLSLAVVSNAAVFSDAVKERRLNVYELRIAVLQNILAEECQMYKDYQKQKRQLQLNDQDFQTHLQIDKLVYFRMHADLVKCRKMKSAGIQKPVVTRKPPVTTGPKVTSPRPLETEPCLAAVNFTESWRRDHNGSNFKPGGPHSSRGYACDLHVDTQWFRFTGDAGTRMLNTCPKRESCGATIPIWTDGEMPTKVGVKTTINAYEVVYSDCKAYTKQVEVLRCAANTGTYLVYKFATPYHGENYSCVHAFCGMEA